MHVKATWSCVPISLDCIKFMNWLNSAGQDKARDSYPRLEYSYSHEKHQNGRVAATKQLPDAEPHW